MDIPILVVSGTPVFRILVHLTNCCLRDFDDQRIDQLVVRFQLSSCRNSLNFDPDSGHDDSTVSVITLNSVNRGAILVGETKLTSNLGHQGVKL